MQSKAILVTLVALSVFIGGYEALLYHFGRDIGVHFATMWVVVFYVLVALWVDAESHERKDIYCPFEYDYLVFLFAIVYVPYYLVRTRGALGILWFVALVVLFYLGYFLQWLLYAMRYAAVQ